MTIELHNLVISSIKRQDRNQVAVANTRPQENDVRDIPEKIITKLTGMFKGAGMKVGDFSVEPEQMNFSRQINRNFIREEMSFGNFRQFADNISKFLAQKLNTAQAQSAKDGFLISYYFSQDLSVGDEENVMWYLCVIFLHRIDGQDINDVDLTFEEIERINLDSLSLGAKICINEFLDGTDRPISFKLGKGTGDVRKFFQSFLGCDEPKDCKADTKALKDAITETGKSQGLNSNQIHDLCERAREFCNERIKSAQDGTINLDVIASHLFPDEERRDEFFEIAHETYRLSDAIGIDTSELRKFASIQAKTDKYRFSFIASELNDTVEFSKGEKSIKFKNLPDNVVADVSKYLPDENLVEV